MASAGAAAIAAQAASADDVAAVVGPSGDAFEVASFMVERQGLGRGQVIYLPDATPEGIAGLFPTGGGTGQLVDAAGGSVDRAIFYFAGTGARGDDGRAYIVDGSGGERYPLDDAFAGMLSLGAEQAIVILEGDFGGAPIAPPDGVTVVLAAVPGEAAQRDPDVGLGVFTMALLAGATTAADANGDGVVSAGEGADFSALAMERWAAADAGRSGQTPGLIGDETIPLFDASSPEWRLRAPSADALDRAWIEEALARWGSDPAGVRAARLAPAPPAPIPPPADQPSDAPPAPAADAPADEPEPPAADAPADEPEQSAADEPETAASQADDAAQDDEPAQEEQDAAGLAAGAAAGAAAAGAAAGAAADALPSAPSGVIGGPLEVESAPEPADGSAADEGEELSTASDGTSTEEPAEDETVAAEEPAEDETVAAEEDAAPEADAAVDLADAGEAAADADGPVPRLEPSREEALAGGAAATGAAAESGGGGSGVLLGVGAAALGGLALAGGGGGGGGGDPAPPPSPPPSPPPGGSPPPGPPPPAPPPPGAPPPPPPAAPSGTPGPDTFTLSSQLTTPIDLLAGADTLVLDPDGSVAPGAFIEGGADTDTIEIDGGLGELDLGQIGPNTAFRGFERLDISERSGLLTLSGAGTIAEVSGRGEESTVSLTGALTGNIGLGGGEDELRLSGALTGAADLGGGDDLFVHNGGALSGSVSGGGGNDAFRIGSALYDKLPALDPATSATPNETVRVLDLNQFDPGAQYTQFETIELDAIDGDPLALVGDAAIGVDGSSSSDLLHVLGQPTGDITLGGGGDRLIAYDGFSLAGAAEVDGGDGVDRLVIFNAAPRTVSLPADAADFEIVEKLGPGALTLSSGGGSGLEAIDVHAGSVTLTGSFAPGGGDVDVFGGSITLVGNFLFGSAGSSDLAPIEVYEGGVLAANGTLTFASGGDDDPPAALYVEGGELSPGGAGALGAMRLVAQPGFGDPDPFEAVPVLGFFRSESGGEPARLFLDWAAGSVTDTISVAHDGPFVAGATTVDRLLIHINPLSPGAIGPGSTAIVVTAETFLFGPSESANPADATITFEGVPAGLAAFYSFEPAPGGQALRVGFGVPLGALSPVATPGVLEGGALATSAATGGALDGAAGLASSAAPSLGLTSASGGWAEGGPAFRAGVTRRSFFTRVSGAPLQAVSEATRSTVATAALGGRLVAGLGAGVERASYGENPALREAMRLTGRTQAGYVSAFLAGEAAGWRIAAASDIAHVDFRFDSPTLRLVETTGLRTRTEARASRHLEVAGASLDLDLGVRHVYLAGEPYRRDDGLWAAGPSARFTSASLGLALRREAGRLAPFLQVSEPVSGEGEGWRLVGVRMSRPRSGLAFDAVLGELDDPRGEPSTHVEARLSLRF